MVEKDCPNLEKGTIDDIPAPQEIAEEKVPDPPIKNNSLPKGFIVGEMDGVAESAVAG
ncbi:MAG TPA: hypothetical protein VND20_11885 [Candidatus Binataceae bacterium]|nr:hypothetical protein [Candidatus Binataceae bacterium]